MQRFMSFILVVAFAIPSLTAQNRQADPPAVTPDRYQPVAKTNAKKHWYQVGKASWYGHQFQGKETASGEAFNMHDLTAAHRTLPLGSLVRVTNLANGKQVTVRINDRGPVYRTRVIDVSYQTATVLGFRAHGIQNVRLDLVALPAEIAEEGGAPSLQ